VGLAPRAIGVSVADPVWEALCSARASVCRPITCVERVERGRLWVIVRNESSGVHVRVDPRVWQVLEQLDGHRTVADAYREVIVECSDDSLKFDDFQPALGQAIATLEQAGIVSTGLAGAAERQWARADLHDRSRRRARWSNPLAVRVPLHNPDQLLSWLVPCLSRLPRRPIVWLWGLMLMLTVATLISSFERIGVAFSALMSSPRQWWSLLLVWPLLKLAHELAHAVAVHRFGGRVHEWGVTLLVLMPVPYVDASDATLFSKRHRLLVGAAGMLAELTIAALALLCWSLTEPGLVSNVLFAVVVAGSVTTVLFNANPLLRFDGYHVLQDAIGIPNLGARASRWWLAWMQCRLFGLGKNAGPLTESSAEQAWFAGYGFLSLLYRYIVVVGIALWLLDTLPLIGVVLTGFALWPMLVKPLVSLIRWLLAADILAGRRASAVMMVCAYCATVVILVTAVPLPSSTRVTGVVATDGSSPLVAPESGHLVVLASERVAAGDLVARIDAPQLADEAALFQAERARLESVRASVARTDALETRLLGDELDVLAQKEAALEARIASLDIRAMHGGLFVPANGGVHAGRLLSQGDQIGQIVSGKQVHVRAIVRERQLERLRDGVNHVKVRLAESISQAVDASLLGQTPAAHRDLPSAALAGNGLGGIAVAEVNSRLETLEPVFHVELGLPEELDVAGIGGRAYITFAHPAESLADRWWRMTRQLFLERLVT